MVRIAHTYNWLTKANGFPAPIHSMKANLIAVLIAWAYLTFLTCLQTCSFQHIINHVSDKPLVNLKIVINDGTIPLHSIPRFIRTLQTDHYLR